MTASSLPLAKESDFDARSATTCRPALAIGADGLGSWALTAATENRAGTLVGMFISDLLPFCDPCAFLRRESEGGVLVCCLSVLARYVDTGTQGLGTKIGAVFQKPLIPPSRLRVNLEIGASGTVEKVVRRRPGTLSTWPTRVMSIWPLRAATMSGSFRSTAAGAQVDGAFEGLFEEGGFRLGEADHRAGWALLGVILDSRTRRSGYGRCRGTRSGVG